jgi:hypothetical protein
MCRDARIYPDPEEFKPERFIAADGSLITENFPPTYGFGRRSVSQFSLVCTLTEPDWNSACAGKSMADASVWIAIASILSVFQIGKAKDTAGNTIDVPDEYIDGLVTSVPKFCVFVPFFSHLIVSAPVPFQCSILPRSEAASHLITDTPPLLLHSNPMYYDEEVNGPMAV